MTKQITIKDLLQMFLQHIKLIIAVTLLGALLAFLYVSFMVTPMYTTSALILVQNSNSFEVDSIDNNSKNKTVTGERVNMQDISSSVTLANTCAMNNSIKGW